MSTPRSYVHRKRLIFYDHIFVRGFVWLKLNIAMSMALRDVISNMILISKMKNKVSLLVIKTC